MNRNLMIIGSVVILVLGTLAIYFSLNNGSEDAGKFKTEYEELNTVKNDEGKVIEVSIPRNNAIVYSNLTEILDVIKNGTGVVYFGFPTCPWCRNMVPVLLEATKENKVDKIYYLDPKPYRGTDNAEYAELIDILSDHLDVDDNGNKMLYVPDVYFIKDGKIIGHNLGTVDSQKDPYVVLTKDQRKELKDIYNNFIKKIK